VLTTARIALGSIAVGVLVLALKLLAYRLTGSIALLSDALESIINVAASFGALVAVRVAEKPADRDHPYGHYKAEYFSAVAEGVLIVVAAGLILVEAYGAFMRPRGFELGPMGLSTSILASAINGGWAWLLIQRGRRLRSPALAADGRHLRMDVISSVGVLGGLGLATATGWSVLDPVIAVLIAFHILGSGWMLVRTSVSGLMDEALSESELTRIRDVIARHSEGAIQAHKLQTRMAGRATFIDFHLVVPGSMTVKESHDICDRIERALGREVRGALVTIHVEPEHKAERSGVVPANEPEAAEPQRRRRHDPS
jgi:cation diffusion facilitator family transporter